MYQSGVDFKCPYSNRPLSPYPLNRHNIRLVVHRISESPYQLNWYMSSAIDFYLFSAT
jgi:hypothetical protein